MRATTSADHRIPRCRVLAVQRGDVSQLCAQLRRRRSERVIRQPRAMNQIAQQRRRLAAQRRSQVALRRHGNDLKVARALAVLGKRTHVRAGHQRRRQLPHDDAECVHVAFRRKARTKVHFGRCVARRAAQGVQLLFLVGRLLLAHFHTILVDIYSGCSRTSTSSTASALIAVVATSWQAARTAKVAQHGAAVVANQHVQRLQIAIDERRHERVHARHRATHVARPAQQRRPVELEFRVAQHVVQRFTRVQLQHQTQFRFQTNSS
mmetsp:Transcript_13173/g.22624  ORF Transcript_13173/g.22624 Transcript_13173/m.22624 type:complete len:265 (+) Transcript_13173:1524-2318(+)